MFRLIGICLIWGGCVFWGLQAVEGVHRRVRLLEDMGQALEVLERELTLNRTALPELLERLSNRSTQQARVLFCDCNRSLQQGSSFMDAWTSALKKSGMKQEEQTLLSGLTQVLGRYDAQGQAQALAHLKRELERRCARQREETRALGRVYCALGVTAGGFLALTLL